MIAAILLSTLIPVVLLVGIVYIIFKITNKESSNFMSPKEFGMELGIFVSLVSSVGALISVVFTAIDKKYPDVLANTSYVSSPMNEDVRMAISILFVAFPLYLVLAWARAKYFEKNADRRNITSLKWPHYVTIFVSLFSIATSVVVTIYYYLGGELVARFGLKMLTVLVILLGLAAYHYFLVKRDYSKKSLIPLVFTLISSVLVLGSIIYSINVLGSPSEIRKQRFDDKRLEDLSQIQQQVLSFWTRSKTLPTDLKSLYSDGISSGLVVPTDPSTKQSYTYEIVQNSQMVKAKGQDCVSYYPTKFNSYNQGSNYDVSKITCEMPTKATFKICANFESVRMYDENGMDQRGNSAFDYTSPKYASYNSDVAAVYYMGGGYDKNPNWNHEAGNQCFERTIDPVRYPNY
jgi:uncharacterized membrane protein